MGYLSISSHEIPGFHVCDLPFPTPWTLPIPCVSPPGAVPCPPGTSFLSPGSEPHFLYFSAFRSPVVRPRTHSWCLPFAAFLSMVHFSARLFCIGFFCLFFRIFYLFLDRGRHQCAAASHAPPTGDLASTQSWLGLKTRDPLIHRLALNYWVTQAGAILGSFRWHWLIKLYGFQVPAPLVSSWDPQPTLLATNEWVNPAFSENEWEHLAKCLSVTVCWAGWWWLGNPSWNLFYR